MFIQRGHWGSDYDVVNRKPKPHLIWSFAFGQWFSNVYLRKRNSGTNYFGCRRKWEFQGRCSWNTWSRGPQWVPPRMASTPWTRSVHDLSPGHRPPAPAPRPSPARSSCASPGRWPRAWPTSPSASLSTAIWPPGTAWWVRTWVVKIADFGLSRNIYSADYYKVCWGSTPSPSGWMPWVHLLQPLHHGVWRVSLRAVSWEISPWPAALLRDGPRGGHLLRADGNILSCPITCPLELHELAACVMLRWPADISSLWHPPGSWNAVSGRRAVGVFRGPTWAKINLQSLSQTPGPRGVQRPSPQDPANSRSSGRHGHHRSAAYFSEKKKKKDWAELLDWVETGWRERQAYKTR